MRQTAGGVSVKPVLLIVERDPKALERMEPQLRRYAGDYRLVFEDSSGRALSALERMRETGEDVALVLAAQWMPEITGAELLARLRDIHPNSKRGLLVDWGAWGDRPTADAILRAMALGHIDYYVLKPWRSPDEFFHRTITEFLHEWWRAASVGPREITVVGERWSPRSHELRSLLARNGVPHVFHASDSAEGSRLLREAGHEATSAPVVILLDGSVLVDP